jgi:hypothetical protein
MLTAIVHSSQLQLPSTHDGPILNPRIHQEVVTKNPLSYVREQNMLSVKMATEQTVTIWLVPAMQPQARDFMWGL